MITIFTFIPDQSLIVIVVMLNGLLLLQILIE